MPFCFVYICDLLDQLERLETLDPPIILPQLLDHKRNERIISWFKHHRKRIDAFDTDGDALLATLLPDRRTDRVYGLDNRRLEQVVARVLNLSIDRYAELRKWQEMDGPDLPRCVEQVMNADTFICARTNSVTVEEIDQSLLLIASRNDSSSPAVRSLATNEASHDPIQILGNIYCRLQAREAKWLTRLILKDYAPIKFPESLVYKSNHTLLPNLMEVRAEFASYGPVALRREGSGVTRGVGGTESTIYQGPTPPPSSEPVTNKPSPGSSTSQLARLKTSKPILPARSMIFVGTSACQLNREGCALLNCIFLLGPCTSSMLWLTENLLPWHGSLFVASANAFSDLSIPRRCPQTSKKFRKIALVESNRPAETITFIKSIMKVGLKSPSGKKEWVEVYDWRLLESIAKVDRGKELGYDPWRRCWIGAV